MPKWLELRTAAKPAPTCAALSMQRRIAKSDTYAPTPSRPSTTSDMGVSWTITGSAAGVAKPPLMFFS